MSFAFEKITYNERFIFQFNVNCITLQASATAGERTAQLHFEGDYGSERPFNTSLEVFAGVDTQSVGLSSHIASDSQWQNFTGKSSVRLTYNLRTLDDILCYIKLKC